MGSRNKIKVYAWSIAKPSIINTSRLKRKKDWIQTWEKKRNKIVDASITEEKIGSHQRFSSFICYLSWTHRLMKIIQRSQKHSLLSVIYSVWRDEEK